MSHRIYAEPAQHPAHFHVYSRCAGGDFLGVIYLMRGKPQGDVIDPVAPDLAAAEATVSIIQIIEPSESRELSVFSSFSTRDMAPSFQRVDDRGLEILLAGKGFGIVSYPDGEKRFLIGLSP